MRVDAHDQVHDLVGGDLGEPMGRVRRDDDDVARAELAALAAQHFAAVGTRAIEDRDHRAGGRDAARILDRAAGHEGPVAGNDVVDLRDLAVLDAERAGLILHLLGLRHVLVGDVELDRARRSAALVLVAVDGAARDEDEFADLEHPRRLALDGVGDLALLHRPPLIAGMAMKHIARTRRNDDGLHPHNAGRVLLKRLLEIGRGPELRIGLRRLRPRNACRQTSRHRDGRDYQLVHRDLPGLVASGKGRAFSRRARGDEAEFSPLVNHHRHALLPFDPDQYYLWSTSSFSSRKISANRAARRTR
jgi:hypothetical protein